MTGKEVAELFWGLLRKRGFQVMDGDWDATDPKLQAAWDEFASEMGHSLGESDDIFQDILAWSKEGQQKLYELLYAAGCRIR